MNPNADLADREGVLAALPIRATRAPINGDHTMFVNHQGLNVAVRAVSHKVSAEVTARFARWSMSGFTRQRRQNSSAKGNALVTRPAHELRPERAELRRVLPFQGPEWFG